MQKEFALFGLNKFITNLSNIWIVFQIFTGKKGFVKEKLLQCSRLIYPMVALSVYSRYVTQ